jgi:transcriptional regulator with XRE-family HTH domain
MSIGNNIFEFRRQKKLTQAQLAEKLCVTEQSVSKWENDICAPDVSLFPALAKLFGVSIDRIFGFHLDTYDKEVDVILKEAEEGEDINKTIEILDGGLHRYPNSDKLKAALAWYYSMLNRMAADEAERKMAVDKAVMLCGEIIGTSTDNARIDEAYILLQRIYTELGEYEKALDAVGRLSHEKYHMRITGISSVLAGKKDVSAQLKYTEKSLFLCWLTMVQLLKNLTSSLFQTAGDCNRALEYHALHRRLLELFDNGNTNFYTAHKLWESDEAAMIYMKLGEKEKCIDELKRFIDLCADACATANMEDHKIAHRCRYFSDIEDEELYEEYMSSIDSKLILSIFSKYAEFLSGEPAFCEIQKEAASL